MSANDPIDTAVRVVVQDHLNTLGEGVPSHVYRMVADRVEKPLLDVMMNHTRGNQSQAAEALGINRATLRTRLQRHGML